MQFRELFVTRDVSALMEETHSKGEELRRSIGAFGLTALGVGAIIGTGIFVVIGKGAAVAGPGAGDLLCAGRGDLHLLGALVRRAVVQRAGLGQRVHLLLRDTW